MGEPDDRPLCFVLMPFGLKGDSSGREVNFDAVYQDVIRPAIVDAGMEPLRADEERDGGIIHKPMFERLVLCPFAVGDLTLANANVFYELGVRHAVRPHTTVLLFSRGGQQMPFDVAPLRALPYTVGPSGRVEDPLPLVAQIADRLRAARDPVPDSPLYQLLDGFVPPDIARLKTDVFRDHVRYSESVKKELAAARRSPDPVAAVAAVHDTLRPIADREAGVAIDLLLSYRATKQFDAMVAVVEEMAPPVRAAVMTQEQLAFALNRIGRDEEAEAILVALDEQQGASSETLGLLGRIHKDRWRRARAAGSPAAPAHLRKAIAAYRRGFEADWRDAFPGVNAVTLLEVQQPAQDDVALLAPVVRYAALRRAGRPDADYWDHATLLEVAVVVRDEENVTRLLEDALAMAADPWMTASTADNLTLVAEAREAAGEDTTSIRGVIEALVGTP